QVAEVVRNLSIRDKDKGLSAGEKRMLQKARQILVSELTFAIGVFEAEGQERLHSEASLTTAMTVLSVGWARGAWQRFGSAKQYAELGDKRLIDHAVTNAAAASDFVVVGAPADDVTDLRWAFASTTIKVIPGGVLRSDTVRAALAVIPADAEVII